MRRAGLAATGLGDDPSVALDLAPAHSCDLSGSLAGDQDHLQRQGGRFMHAAGLGVAPQRLDFAVIKAAPTHEVPVAERFVYLPGLRVATGFTSIFSLSSAQANSAWYTRKQKRRLTGVVFRQALHHLTDVTAGNV